MVTCLVNRLHSRLTGGLIRLGLLGRLCGGIHIINRKTEANELEETVGEVLRLLEREALRKESALVQ